MTIVELRPGSATDVGSVRQVNEDSSLSAPPVFVVADGMGGHAGGDVASRLVVEAFAELGDGPFDSRRGAEAVVASLAQAQARILDYAAAQRADKPRWHAGTTAVVALLVEHAGAPAWLLANLGDSRIYRLVDGRLAQVSVDHSVVQELLDAGQITAQEATVHPERHVITRALGSPGAAEPDFFLVPVADAPRVLLCSDGVTGMIDDAGIEEILGEEADPEVAAERLVAAAVAAGGHDNATAVVVDAFAGQPAVSG